MASMLLGSFPIASSVTGVGSRRRSKRIAKSYHASSCVTKASWSEIEKIRNEYPTARHHRSLNNHYGGIEAASTCEDHARSFVVNAARGESFGSAESNDPGRNLWCLSQKLLNTFYKFTRPYVMIATAINITAMALLAVEKSSDISLTFFIGLLKAMAIIIPMNFYVIGVNDLADVEIDKINKPYLPSASGEYSSGHVLFITMSSVILSFGLGWIVGSPPLLWLIFSHFIFGSAYSIDFPLLRWKRSTVLTAINYIIDRAIVLNLAVFLHMQAHVLKRPTMLPRSLIFSMVFMSFFNTVIALSKDIPDIEGDEKFGIRSLSVRLGKKRVFWTCVLLLEMTYGISILVGATSSSIWSKLITVLGHAFLACVLGYHAKSIDLESKASTQSFYMFIWKLFYAEYLLLPFVR